MKFVILWYAISISSKAVYSFKLLSPSSKGRATRADGFRKDYGIVTAASKESQRGERKGFYVRPSAAIEKGGGFFIPGLEGEWRLRVLCSSIVAILLAANRFPGYEVPQSQVVSESVGATAAVLLLVQALSKTMGLKPQQKDEELVPVAQTNRVSFVTQKYSQVQSENLSWAANAMLDLVACRGAVLVHDGQVDCLSGYYENSHPWASGTPAIPRGWKCNYADYTVIRKSDDPDLFACMPVGCNYIAVQPVRCTEKRNVSLEDMVWLLPLEKAWEGESEQREWIERISQFTSLQFV